MYRLEIQWYVQYVRGSCHVFVECVVQEGERSKLNQQKVVSVTE